MWFQGSSSGPRPPFPEETPLRRRTYEGLPSSLPCSRFFIATLAGFLGPEMKARASSSQLGDPGVWVLTCPGVSPLSLPQVFLPKYRGDTEAVPARTP